MNAGTAVAPGECAVVNSGPHGVAKIFGDIFVRPAPLVLDLGCGNGAFLSALAAREPDYNCLGVEKKDYRVRQAQRRSAGLANARVVQGEVGEVLGQFAAGSMVRVYLLFSDPWPKRRHAVRRLVQIEFVRLLSSRMVPGGKFYFASDAASYFSWSRRVFASAGWEVSDWSVSPDWPPTEFERRFVAEGLNVHRFCATSP